MIDTLMWIVTAASIVGTIANVKQKHWCFGVWMFTNASWTAYDIYKTAYPQAGLMVIYFCLSVWGWFHWRQKATANNEGTQTRRR